MVCENQDTGKYQFKCKKIKDRKSDAFFKAQKILEDMHGPCMTYYFGLISKEMVVVELDNIKQEMGAKFDNIIDFTEEIRQWLVTFVKVNEY